MEQNINKNIGVNILLELENLGKTGTKLSAILDTEGFPGIVLGVCTGTFIGADESSYLKPILQESSTTVDADFTNVASENIEGDFVKIHMANMGEDSTIQTVFQYVEYKGHRRYVRVKLEYIRASLENTGFSSGGVIVQGILGQSRKLPVPTLSRKKLSDSIK